MMPKQKGKAKVTKNMMAGYLAFLFDIERATSVVMGYRIKPRTKGIRRAIIRLIREA
jgi:hypothetical protein